MDNWLIFQYCVMTEMWGRGQEGRAGNEETGASEVPVGEANPPGKGKTRRGGRTAGSCRP